MLDCGDIVGVEVGKPREKQSSSVSFLFLLTVEKYLVVYAVLLTIFYFHICVGDAFQVHINSILSVTPCIIACRILALTWKGDWFGLSGCYTLVLLFKRSSFSRSAFINWNAVVHYSILQLIRCG
jgi:hypothetical protein